VPFRSLCCKYACKAIDFIYPRRYASGQSTNNKGNTMKFFSMLVTFVGFALFAGCTGVSEDTADSAVLAAE